MDEPTPVPTHIEISVAQWDQMQKAQDRARRSLVRLVLVVLLVVGTVVVFLGWRSYGSQERQDRANSQAMEARTRQACIATLTGDAFGRLADALAAPPVANGLSPEEFAKTPRGVAVKSGLADAHKLENIDRYC